jgi:hypothetical protein
MTSTRGQHCVYKEKNLENEMVISFNQTMGHFGLQKTA